MTDHPHPRWRRWADVDRVLAEALDRPPADRAAYLARACGDDAELLTEARRLLAAVDASEGWLEQPGPEATRQAVEDLGSRVDPPPRRAGAYEILRELGRGGMSTVFLAERQGDGFRQRAAVKVLRRGLDTADIVRRFRRERHILARLTHPGIARLLDGGATSDGRPYLAMEYVEGEPITRYCDRTRRSIRERLDLFLEVAGAVQAAHASLVIHRDLKPSNIFVSNGRVKLLDFGIAKLLDAEAGDDESLEPTRAGISVLTPEIASPEQRRGAPVTTATDIYQVGVLLFQLLAGCRPADAAGTSPATDRADAPRPSAAIGTGPQAARVATARATTPERLRRALRGDLDTIVLQAIHADADRRYASVERLAADIRRHLDGQTISARPDTLAYRARTFLRRRPWVAPVAAALAIAGVAYGATLVRYARRLETERDAARLQATRAQQAQRFLVDLFRSPDPYGPADPDRGRQITVVEALDVGAKRLESELANQPVVRESLLGTIADVYQNLGSLNRALPLRQEVLSLQQARNPSSTEVIDSLGQLASIYARLGRTAQARATDARRLALARALRPPQPAEVASALIDMGVHLVTERRLDEAQAHLREAVRIGATGGVPAERLAEAHRSLADVDTSLDRYDDALREAQAALALRLQANGKRAIPTALAEVTLGQTLGDLRRFDEAESHLQIGLDILEPALGQDAPLTMTAVSSLALVHLRRGDPAGALDLQRRVLDSTIRTSGAHSRLTADAYQNLGTTLARLGRFDEARAMHERAATAYREAVEPGSYFLALPSLSLANIDLAQQHYARAEGSARQALAILKGALPDDHPITAIARCRVARALVGRGDPAAAEPFFDRAVTVLRDTDAVPQYRAQCLGAAITFYDAHGKADEAKELREALEHN